MNDSFEQNEKLAGQQSHGVGKRRMQSGHHPEHLGLGARPLFAKADDLDII